jgi:hypothetical protein
VSWGGARSRADAYLRSGLLAAPNLGDIRFALLYESLEALEGRALRVVFDEATIDRLLGDMDYAASRYLAHPRYLRIDGRPALFLYVSRNFEGRHRDGLGALRRRLATRGLPVYLVGDEVFWHEPRRGRMRLFDAVTAYTLYDWPRRDFAGYAGAAALLRAAGAQLARHRAMATRAGVGFVPAVIPGYNDRGVRPDEEHPVVPRRFGPEAEEGGPFAEALRTVGLPHLDDRTRLLLLTSFNEWHEWTQIEPTRPSPATTRDASGRDRFTTGLAHGGYGLRYLELLRDAVVAASGRVRTVRGEPVAGGRVEARRDGRRVAETRTDSAGGFRFGRLDLEPGRYELTAAPGGARTVVVIGDGHPAGPVELVSEASP